MNEDMVSSEELQASVIEVDEETARRRREKRVTVIVTCVEFSPDFDFFFINSDKS